MAKTAAENAGYWRRGGLVGDAKSGKMTTSVTSTTVGSKPKAAVTKTAPSRPVKPVKPPTSRGGGPVNPPVIKKTVFVGAKSKAPTRSQSPVVTHVAATSMPPTKKKKTT